MGLSKIPADGKLLVQKHKDVLRSLETAATAEKSSRQAIAKAVNRMASEALNKILREIPVDEINRDKRGIRVSALKNNGYNNLADLYRANIYKLTTIRGISEDAAYEIKEITNELVLQAQKDIKIKLSMDQKTTSATLLVKSIFQYQRVKIPSKGCAQLLSENKAAVLSAIELLELTQSGLRWLFTGKAKKELAYEAYTFLQTARTTGYVSKAEPLLSLLSEAQDISAELAWEEFGKQSISYFNILEEICPGILGNDDEVYGLPEELAQEVQNEVFFPEGLRCELRRYQEWGVKYILHQEKVLLGDEMGLGKTIQAIATMVSLKNTGATHFLVICPASVIENWCREIRKHSKLSSIKIHGVNREMALQEWVQVGGVAVTNYETTGIFYLPMEFRFSLAVVDEAHYIKNPEAKRTKNVQGICSRADRMLFMTGTAMENKVDEMINLISMLQLDIAHQAKCMASLASAPKFREVVAPVYYRRKREDVLTELPDLIETEEWCCMGQEEEEIYERAVLARKYVESRRVSWSVDDLRLSSKANRMMEIIEEAAAEGRKVIVFSYFLDTIRKVSMLMGARAVQPINGSVQLSRRQEIIDEFDQAPAGTVLPAQIQAGGTGLNIQSASVVIICEPQFKPSIENQAISRAYRMGQTRNVLVYRLLCENSVDERITDLLAHKQAEFDAYADESVAAAVESRELDQNKFNNIINEEIERINAKYGNKLQEV